MHSGFDRFKRWLPPLGSALQIGMLIVIWAVAESAAHRLAWPVPGSVLGLLTLWFLLGFNWVPITWIEQGADGLLNHLLLFYVPAMLAIVNRPELLSALGIKLVFAVLVGTVIVMCGTAAIVELCFRLKAHDDAL